ncbi:fucose isomerase [Stetteria hydrogenophila]
MRMLLVGFASRLHGESYYKALFRGTVEALSGFKGLEVHPSIVTEPSAIDAGGYDLVLAYLLTGGTSKLAYRVLTSAARRPVVILAHSKHNSLASALSLRSRLAEAGVKVKLLYFRDRDDLLEKFTLLYKGVAAGYGLQHLRIVEVNDQPDVSAEGKLFADKFGAEIIHVGYEELWRVAEEAGAGELRELRDAVGRYIDLSGVEEEHLDKVLRVYYALRRLTSTHKANAVVIDCFPLILKYKVTPCLAVAMLNAEGVPTACENDYYSLIPLHASLALTGHPGWVANPSGVTSDGRLRFAHCTIAPSLGRNCFLMPHFESGRGYAVACEYKAGAVLFVRVDRDINGLTVYRGTVVRSGMLEPGYCRTQLVVDTGALKPEEFIENATGNHHVFIPWSEGLTEALKHMAWWLGWRVDFRN